MKLTKVITASMAIAVLGVVLPSPPAAAAEVATCTWLTPEYPHISSHNLQHGGTIDIKASTQGTCNPAQTALFVTAEMTLERQEGLFGWWTPVAVGAPVTKGIQGGGAVFRRGELFAVMPCVPGVYRGRLLRSYRTAGGVAIPLGGPIYSPGVRIDCKPKRVSMVIDDTGSMAPVIGSVRSALSTYITGQPEDEYTLWNLTTFKDSPRNVGTTPDRGEVVGWVGALTAAGGGDCPEDALGGISTGLSELGAEPGSDKQMIVATDASTQAGDVDGIISQAQVRGVRVNVLLTGDCDTAAARGADQNGGDRQPQKTTEVTTAESSQVVLKRIAAQTGGKYFFLPEGDTADFTKALNEIFAQFVNPAPSPSASPSASPGPGLPVTGRNLLPLATVGVTLLIAGTWLVLWARRRKPDLAHD